MGVYGYVGLTGSGKTRRVVKALLEAHGYGSEVWANFRLGSRVFGYMVPLCGRSVHWSGEHQAESYEFRQSTPVLDDMARERSWRRGLGFLPAPDANVLVGGWEQLMALRVFRDEMGKAHRCELVERSAGWTAVRACLVFDCDGCSRGLTVGIDELNQWAPAREWAKLGPGVLNRLAYVRKDGIDLHWSAQHERRIDTVPRELTEYIWSCSVVGGRVGRIRLQLFRREKWVPALMTDKSRVVTGEGATGGGMKGSELELVFKIGRDLATREERAYDTYEHVTPAAALGVDLVPSAPERPARGAEARVGSAVTPQGASAASESRRAGLDSRTLTVVPRGASAPRSKDRAVEPRDRR